jgi:hypothetical protein
MPGLVPGMTIGSRCREEIVDGRAKPGHDKERGRSVRAAAAKRGLSPPWQIAAANPGKGPASI